MTAGERPEDVIRDVLLAPIIGPNSRELALIRLAELVARAEQAEKKLSTVPSYGKLLWLAALLDAMDAHGWPESLPYTLPNGDTIDMSPDGSGDAVQQDLRALAEAAGVRSVTAGEGRVTADGSRIYEADGRGLIYEKYEDGSVWPTGIVMRGLAGQSNIPADVFDRELRRLDELEGRA